MIAGGITNVPGATGAGGVRRSDTVAGADEAGEYPRQPDFGLEAKLKGDVFFGVMIIVDFDFVEISGSGNNSDRWMVPATDRRPGSG
ncbi:MAG: hypothetical protein R3F37_05585 [Candidatus Competibacteraceae bacterium]